MIFKKCTKYEDVICQTGLDDEDICEVIKRRFDVHRKWYEDLIYGIIQCEIQFLGNLEKVCLSLRIAPTLVGLDEADTLALLKIYSDANRNLKRIYLVDLFYNLEYADETLQNGEAPKIFRNENSAMIIRTMHKSIDDATKELLKCLFDYKINTLEFDGTISIKNLNDKQ